MSVPAIILAAGRGIRLGDITSDIPKGLLEVGGRTLIDRQIDCLESMGITEIHLVVGYKYGKIEQSLKLRGTGGSKLNCMYNPRWDTANNIYSLYMARDVSLDGFVVINSDDLFHPGILKRLLDDPAPDALSLDDVKTLGEEEMKVKLVDGAVAEINKTMAADSAHGEYIGIAKFGKEGAGTLFDILDGFVRRNAVQGWYEEAFGVFAQCRELIAVSTGGLPWTEIDTPEDLDTAEKILWPRILKRLEAPGD